MRDSGGHHDPIGEGLAAWGKVALIETRGRITGRLVSVAVGFVDAPDGSVLVAAGADDSDWALNLRHDQRCTVAIGEFRSMHTRQRSGAQRSTS